MRTSSLHRPIIQLSSKRVGNHPRTHRRSSSGIRPTLVTADVKLTISSTTAPPSWNSSGWSATCFPHNRIKRIASMFVSGYSGLHANSDRHFTQSWPCEKKQNIRDLGLSNGKRGLFLWSWPKYPYLEAVNHSCHVGDIQLGDYLVDGLESQFDDGFIAIRCS